MITLSKLAQLAHVSISTASKAFSGSHEVNEQTREHIFALAKEHGVFKKFYNAKCPHLVIAVIVPEFQGGHYGHFLDALRKCLREKGCTVSVTTWDFSPEESKRVYDYYSNYTDVDGVILVENQTPFLNDLIAPAVVVGATDIRSDATGVSIDYTLAVEDALRYFKEKNVATVGILTERRTGRKLEIFKSAIEKIYGAADERYIVVSDSRFEECGYEGMTRLIEAKAVPRAILCGYDEIAVGAIRALTEHGLSVPEDVAVIGCNDNPSSAYSVPSLSSIDVRHADCAALAVDMVLDKIFSHPIPKERRLDAILRLRASSHIEE